MELLVREPASIQIMTIQTLGRVTECIARLSQTVRALSLMEPLLQNTSPALKNGDGGECVTQVEQLFEGIEHSVKHMELLALSVEQKFQRIEEIVHSCSKSNKVKIIDHNIRTSSSTCTVSADEIEDAERESAIPTIETLHVDAMQYGKYYDELCSSEKDNCRPVQHVCFKAMNAEEINSKKGTDDEVTCSDFEELDGTKPKQTKEKITFLEDRLTSWIKEIDDIDTEIEKSIESSKAIPWKRNSVKLPI